LTRIYYQTWFQRTNILFRRIVACCKIYDYGNTAQTSSSFSDYRKTYDGCTM